MNRFQQWYSVQPRALRALLTINVVAYVVWLLVLIYIGPARLFVYQHLALNPPLPGILLEPWQLVTYSFLHLQPGFWGMIHIAFNMLWLFWIGKEYEDLHGSHRLFSAYVFGSIGGAVLTVLLHNLFPSFGAFRGIVHGASAAVLGVITTVAVRYPYKSVALLFIGTVRLIWLVIGYLALNLLFLSGGNMSVSAHLGGALFGFLLAKVEGSGVDLSGWARLFFPGSSRSAYAPRYGRRDSPGMKDRLGSWFSSKGTKEPARTARVHPLRSTEPEEPRQEDDEIDRILDKISEGGYDSLTEEEKRTLHEASRR